MPEFNTLDLGRIYQTGEAIKSFKRQQDDDLLRRQYMQQQLSAGQQAQDIQKQSFENEKQTRDAKTRYLEAGAILQSRDPVSTAKLYSPELVSFYDKTHGEGSFDQLTPDQVRQMVGQAQSALAAKAGIQPKVKHIDRGGELVAIDENTGLPIAGVQPIQKTASPDSVLSSKTSIRGQDLSAETARRGQDMQSTSSKAPTGYQFKPDGSLAPIPGGPGESNLANQLRDEYTKASKDFVTIADSYTQIKKLSKNVSAAGDLALIFSYMKMLDPGSTVREGEFANAQNAGGIPDRIAAQYNKVLSGERLSTDQRKDFEGQARNVYESQRDRHDKTVKQRYEDLAKKNNLDPSVVVSDLSVPEDVPSAQTKVLNGVTYVKQNGQWYQQ